MIIIYCDFSCVHQVEATSEREIVRFIRDYIPLRQRLRRVLDERGNYTVYIQHPLLAQWLKDLRNYGPQIVHWEEVDLYEYFEQYFGFAPPKELGLSALQDLLGTLSPPPIGALVDPIGWILSQRIDSIWGYAQPSQNHLGNIAAWLVKTDHIPLLLHPLMERRFTEWAKEDDRYKLFLDRPWKEIAEILLLRWALRFYPITFSLRLKLEAYPLVDCSQHTTVCLELLKTHNNTLKHFWHSWLASDASFDIVTAISKMSGLAGAELDVIESWAKTHISLLTAQLLNIIRNRFLDLPHANNVLERLAKSIPPPIPTKPDSLWSSERWLRWVTEAYFPYFAWVIRNRQPRETQIDLASQFENWLLGKYTSFPTDPASPFTPHQMSRIKELFDTKSIDVIMWFIVDGLTWWQGKRLVELCTELQIGGFYLEPTVSVLPTITSISKRALAKGYLEPSDTTKPIAQIVRERLISDIPYISVYTRENEIEEAFSLALQPGLYTLLYNSLDHHCHDIQGFTDTESIDGHLRLLARLIQEGFDRCLRQGLKVKAFVCSDHGSTLLPEQSVVLPLPKFADQFEDNELEDMPDAETKVFQRVRACASDRAPNLDELKEIKKDWHYLQKDVFALPRQFFLPKGYSAVGRRPKGWTHGGATPEEVVVPFIELQPDQVDFVVPMIDITGFLLPRNMSTLHIKLGNTNAFPITILHLLVADSAAEMAQNRVEPDTTVEGEVTLRSAVSQEAIQIITWSLTCEGSGLRQTFTGNVSLPIRRLQISDVDEMFEDML